MTSWAAQWFNKGLRVSSGMAWRSRGFLFIAFIKSLLDIPVYMSDISALHVTGPPFYLNTRLLLFVFTHLSWMPYLDDGSYDFLIHRSLVLSLIVPGYKFIIRHIHSVVFLDKDGISATNTVTLSHLPRIGVANHNYSWKLEIMFTFCMFMFYWRWL